MAFVSIMKFGRLIPSELFGGAADFAIRDKSREYIGKAHLVQ
jgi:hypothetical protein